MPCFLSCLGVDDSKAVKRHSCSYLHAPHRHLQLWDRSLDLSTATQKRQVQSRCLWLGEQVALPRPITSSANRVWFLPGTLLPGTKHYIFHPPWKLGTTFWPKLHDGTSSEGPHAAGKGSPFSFFLSFLCRLYYDVWSFRCCFSQWSWPWECKSLRQSAKIEGYWGQTILWTRQSSLLANCLCV